jgi:hypothetical protein
VHERLPARSKVRAARLPPMDEVTADLPASDGAPCVYAEAVLSPQPVDPLMIVPAHRVYLTVTVDGITSRASGNDDIMSLLPTGTERQHTIAESHRRSPARGGG